MLTPITASVTGFSAMSRHGVSTVWSMIAAERLESVSIGKRRLVLIEPYLKSLGLDPPAYPITVAPAHFPELSGLSTSTTWDLIRSGRLTTVRVGRRQMVIVESYRALIEELRALPRQDARRNKMVPALGSGNPRGPPLPQERIGARRRPHRMRRPCRVKRGPRRWAAPPGPVVGFSMSKIPMPFPSSAR